MLRVVGKIMYAAVMIEHLRDGDLFRVRNFGKKFGERVVEFQFAFFDKLKNHGRREHFRN